MINKVFECLFAAIIVLALLPYIVRMLVQTVGPVLLAAAIVGLMVGAFRSYERTRSRTGKPRGGAGSERTPIPPGEDQ